MTAGLRAKLRVDAPDNCLVAEVSASTGETVGSVHRSGQPAGEEVTEEFTVGASLDRDDVDQVFEHDSGGVYRFSRNAGCNCVCEQFGRRSIPVSNVQAQDGSLFVTFHASGIETLREVVADVRERAGDATLCYLVRAEDDGERDECVVVDLTQLTDRQREVLETAYELGYFEVPKDVTGTEVAAELGIDRSTLAEHLALAQSKLMSAMLDGR